MRVAGWAQWSAGWSVHARSELLAAGRSAWQLRDDLAAGRLTALLPGVYLAGPRLGGAAGWCQDVAAACARRPDAALSGACAAAVWELDGFEWGEPITLNVRPGRSARTAGTRRLAPLGPVVRGDGLTLTGIDETLVDLGAELAWKPGCAAARTPLPPVDRVELALEAALRREWTTVERLLDALQFAGRNRAGRAVLAHALRRRPIGCAPTGSYLETRCVQVLRNAGLPAFERQVELHDGHGRIGYVDLFLDGVVIELVGSEWHFDRFDPDHVRYARLTAAGHRLLPFTFNDVEHRPHHVARTTRAALGLVAT